MTEKHEVQTIHINTNYSDTAQGFATVFSRNNVLEGTADEIFGGTSDEFPRRGYAIFIRTPDEILGGIPDKIPHRTSDGILRATPYDVNRNTSNEIPRETPDVISGETIGITHNAGTSPFRGALWGKDLLQTKRTGCYSNQRNTFSPCYILNLVESDKSRFSQLPRMILRQGKKMSRIQQFVF